VSLVKVGRAYEGEGVARGNAEKAAFREEIIS